MFNPIRSTTAFVLACFLCASGTHAEPLTMEKLLGEMSDLARLAETPSPAYVTRQSSSYDQRSKSPDDHDAWFANNDADNWHGTVQHQGRTERVMLRAGGPGAIVRIWSANPAGVLRIYIDGSETPALEADMASLLSGKQAHLPEPLAGVYSKGYNLYLPIPYAKSCEVTTDAKGFYYSIDYRTYASGTDVVSYERGDTDKYAAAIATQAKSLAAPQTATSPADQLIKFDVNIAPAQSTQLARIDGARALTNLVVQLPEDMPDGSLRSALLKIRFDDQQTVEVPLGDFFGSAPGVNPFESLPLGMTRSRQLRSNWVMPFRESATLEVQNLGTLPIRLSGSVGSIARPWADRSLYFHAGFRAESDRTSQPAFDWNYLTVNGRGRFIGASFAIDNPSKAWWGEGDEKFYIDGETFPSWFGTGTEDYYGYAWCWPGTFTHAYHTQSRCDGPDNYGRTSVNRFHLLDDVPFTKSFKFDMEIWHWKQTKINFAATTYWYADSGATDVFQPLEAKDVVVHPMPAYKPFVVVGAIEGETMKVLKTTGIVEPQPWADTSGDAHLWWRDGKPGDTLTLGFNVERSGRYTVRARFLKAADYGMFKLQINDKPVAQPIDLYHDGVVLSPEVSLGVFDLAKGQNTISATITGTNDAGSKQYLFGLDYLLLATGDAK